MPRLLLVARNPGLAFGLGSASDDIIEVRPSLVGRLEVSPGMADVVVIEQERPDDALTTLDMLRAGGLMAPALLVASARPEWADFDPSSRPSVSVLDPPITQDRLGQSVGSTSGLPDADHGVPSQYQAEPEPEPALATEPDPTWEPEPATDPDPGPESQAEALAPAPHVPDHVEVVFSDALTRDAPFGEETYADPWADQEPSPGTPDTPSELDVEASSLDEDLPIAAAAADASAAAEDELLEPAEDEAALPDGPVDLEPPDDPYATATHVPLEPEPEAHPGFEVPAAVEADLEAEAEPDAEAVAEVEVLAEAEPVADDEDVTDDGAEPEAEDVTDVEAEAVAEVLDETEVEPEGGVLPGSEGRADAAVESEVDAAVEAGPEDEPAPDVDATMAADVEAEDAARTEPAVEDAPEPERVLDTAMLAIPTAAPMRQPEEIRLGTPGPDAVPSVVLYDEEDGLTVADGTPSPAAWQAEPTEPVVAWQSTAKDARVYAEMASLMAASGELLADEPETPEETGVDTGDAVDDMPSVDLSQVFGERRVPAEAVLAGEVLAADVDDTQDEGPADHPVAAEDDDVVEVGQVPEPRSHIEVVDLRDQLPEDPRSTPSLVRALLARSHEVYGVSEAGALVVADALARTGAGAGALLLPDGDSWRVAAGEGLRRLEHRYVLGADSWLVTTIASRHKGVIIDRTDVARRPLAGAPLAAHKHLVAAPVRAVAGILLIARDDDPAFGERDLLSLARLAEASAGILASALDARQLARLLGDIRDQDDRAAADRIDYGL